MKSILMSIKPQYVVKILNREKTLEIRKRFPKDYVGWVYIYCTKDKKYANLINRGGFLTGMVVARFWCDKVDKFYYNENLDYYTDIKDKGLPMKTILEKSCLKDIDFVAYLNFENGCAIHITKLEIFDKPKEIGEFYAYSDKKLELNYHKEARWLTSLTRAPQSWCYIEI